MAFRGFSTLFAADAFAKKKRSQGFRAKVTGFNRGFAYAVIFSRIVRRKK